jgi:hypothetical protein
MVKTGARAAMLLLATVVLTGCTPTAHTYRVYSYECCSARDVDAVYAPGDIIHLHWTTHATTVTAASRPRSLTWSGDFGHPDSR